MCAVACFIGLSAQKAPAEKQSFDYKGTQRTYAMYVPENLKDEAPLVVYVHGYGSKNRWLADLNAAADRHGFAVCYPDGLPDSRGKDGWKVGYPPQESLVIDEADYFRHLLDEVCGRYKLNRENVFCAGMSNGGDLCYQFAYTDPEIFSAYASVAGLTFECTYLNEMLTVRCRLWKSTALPTRHPCGRATMRIKADGALIYLCRLQLLPLRQTTAARLPFPIPCLRFLNRARLWCAPSTAARPRVPMSFSTA